MKKLVLLFMLIGQLTYSQWEKNFYVDEFGTTTENSYESMVSEGVFSNSATKNSKCLYKFVKDDKAIIIYVHEYGNRLATSIDSTFEEVKLKQPDGNVITFKSVFFYKDGVLMFNKELRTKLVEAISVPGDYIMIFNRIGKYSVSNYRINFTIQ